MFKNLKVFLKSSWNGMRMGKRKRSSWKSSPKERPQDSEKKGDCFASKLYLFTTKCSSAIRQAITKAGVMAQPVKSLPGKHKDLSWIPSTHIATLAVGMNTNNYRASGADRRISQACWPASLATQWAPEQWETLHQKTRWMTIEKRHLRLTSGFCRHKHKRVYVYSYGHVLTQAYMHKHMHKYTQLYSLLWYNIPLPLTTL